MIAITLFPILSAHPTRAADLTLDQAVNASSRSPAFIARDSARHPLAELTFFGVTPPSSVVEIWPGNGYWTEILAHYLYDHGHYTLAVNVPDQNPQATDFIYGSRLATNIAAHPEIYGRITRETFGTSHPNFGPAESADVVLTFWNLHNWVNEGDAARMFAGIRHVLKPGGILGIEDHRGNPHHPQNPKAGSGYLRQDYAIALVERAGFKLVGNRRQPT